jgi:hypothetical protein
MASKERTDLERLIDERESDIEYLEGKIEFHAGTSLRATYQEQLARKVDDLMRLKADLKRAKLGDHEDEEVSKGLVVGQHTYTQPERAPKVIAIVSTLTSFGFVRVKDNKTLPTFPEKVSILQFSGAVKCKGCGRSFGNEGGLAMQ